MKNLLGTIPYFEDAKTLALFKEFKSFRARGFLTKDQLIKILRWKSNRPLKRYESNSEESVQEITALAFATKNDILKAHILTALKGVSFPAASAILMFYDKKSYPVIDIRVWTQLYKAKLIDCNERGQNFTLAHWEIYLNVIRNLAMDLNMTARQVEKRLFDHDIKNQTKPIYK
jgi:hypothetical protein